MLEIISPAGSPEAVTAAVQSGADSICVGLGPLGSRRDYGAFSEDEFADAVRYCRVRGVKVYAAMDTLVTDAETQEAVRLVHLAAKLGVNAIVVCDLGLARVIKAAVPNGMPVHFDSRAGLHNLAAVEAAAEAGADRVTLARELSFSQINRIASRASVEVQVSVHGPSCASVAGQCYFSSLTTKRGDNRGRCERLCRVGYSMGGRMDDMPLYFKDSCLVAHIDELNRSPVTAISIEGRNMRPEYTALVTGMYVRAAREKKQPSEPELKALAEAFTAHGFSDGSFTGESSDMLISGEVERSPSTRLLSEARRSYLDTELRRVPVKFYAMVESGSETVFAAEDMDGNRAVVKGEPPESGGEGALTALTAGELEDNFYKTGGTPYQCSEVTAKVGDGVYVSPEALQGVRRELLSQITEIRGETVRERAVYPVPAPAPPVPRREEPAIIIEISRIGQLTPELAALSSVPVYAPITELAENREDVSRLIAQGVRFTAVMPRVVTDSESAEVNKMLRRVRELGVSELVVNNLGHIGPGRNAGFSIRGDYGLNLFSSYTAKMLAAAGLISATASFELKLSQIREMAKPLDTEMIVYGRLPLMLTEQCIIYNSAGRCVCRGVNRLNGRNGAMYPVMREPGCRNMIHSAKKLYLADRRADYADIGLWGARLRFTTESAKECLEVTRAYLGESGYKPNAVTRGLYYRGAE